jgi:hypothetical protein
MEIKYEHIKEIIGVKEKPDSIDVIERKRLKWYGHVKSMQEKRFTYSMEQSFLRNCPVNFAASQGIPRIYGNQKVPHPTHKCPPPDPILGQLHPVPQVPNT